MLSIGALEKRSGRANPASTCSILQRSGPEQRRCKAGKHMLSFGALRAIAVAVQSWQAQRRGRPGERAHRQKRTSGERYGTRQGRLTAASGRPSEVKSSPRTCAARTLGPMSAAQALPVAGLRLRSWTLGRMPLCVRRGDKQGALDLSAQCCCTRTSTSHTPETRTTRDAASADCKTSGDIAIPLHIQHSRQCEAKLAESPWCWTAAAMTRRRQGCSVHAARLEHVAAGRVVALTAHMVVCEALFPRTSCERSTRRFTYSCSGHISKQTSTERDASCSTSFSLSV